MIRNKVLLFVTIGLFFAFSHEGFAKTVNGAAGKTANEASMIGVAGPAPRKDGAQANKSSTQPSKKVLRKIKITPPPPMHDPN